MKVEMSFTDEYSQTTKLERVITSCALDDHQDGTLGFLLDEFKKFLLSSGISFEDVSKIKLKD